MVDVSIGNETSPEANWNRQADRQTGGRTDGQTCVLGGYAFKNPQSLKIFTDSICVFSHLWIQQSDYYFNHYIFFYFSCYLMRIDLIA